MDKELIELIDRCADEQREGKNQPREVILRLLAMDPDGEEAMYARKKACELTHEATGDNGGITFSIGVDYAPCAASCKFCSFGTKWGIATEENKVVLSHEQIIEMAREHIEAGATGVVLRTTEFYPHDDLVALAREMRAAVPGTYGLTVNTGELTLQEAVDFKEAGVQSATHMIRLREGIDTPFPVETRIETIRNIKASGLRWGTCMDPIGPEHTDEEIADLLVLLHSLEPAGIGVMKRSNVPGTPLGEGEELSLNRVMQLVAIVRLTSGFVRSAGCHPAFEETLYSGGNGFCIETGAVPRTSDFVEGDWHTHTVSMGEAAAVIRKAGYNVNVRGNTAGCGCGCS